MGDFGRLVLWGGLAVGLFGGAALLVFCSVTADVFHVEVCVTAQGLVRSVSLWFGG